MRLSIFKIFLLTGFSQLGLIGFSAASNQIPLNMVEIPAGEFIMGSNKTDPDENWKKTGSRAPWYLNEHPRRKLTLDRFLMDKYEVTNYSYSQFVQQTGHKIPANWLENGYSLSLKSEKLKKLPYAALRDIASNIMKLDIDTRQLIRSQLLLAIRKQWQYLDKLPVTHISWYDVNKFCQFHKKRLPTEKEWEKAARGTNGREFVYGNELQIGWSNVGEQYWDDGPAPVSSYPKDKSVYGVFDLAGNVYEWVEDWYKAHPGSDFKHIDFGEKYKVVRGSGFGKDGHYFLSYYQRAAIRSRLLPDDIPVAL